jgi:hypothetical protein
MIIDYLPTYHQVEPNTLKGLQPGFVVSQMNIASSATAALLTRDGKMENGHICGISADGIVKAGSDTKVLFLHYTEPLNTLFKGDRFFAVNPKEECPRLVQLIPGDEWMSDMDPSDVCIEGRIVEISTSVEQYGQDDFYECSELADGTSAHHYMFIG